MISEHHYSCSKCAAHEHLCSACCAVIVPLENSWKTAAVSQYPLFRNARLAAYCIQGGCVRNRLHVGVRLISVISTNCCIATHYACLTVSRAS